MLGGLAHLAGFDRPAHISRHTRANTIPVAVVQWSWIRLHVPGCECSRYEVAGLLEGIRCSSGASLGLVPVPAARHLSGSSWIPADETKVATLCSPIPVPRGLHPGFARRPGRWWRPVLFLLVGVCPGRTSGRGQHFCRAAGVREGSLKALDARWSSRGGLHCRFKAAGPGRGKECGW